MRPRETMPNYGYHLARAQAGAIRRAYRAMLPAIVRQSVSVSRHLPLEVYAYSGEAALPEQIASIRSFLRYAGRPERFTIVSDGSYSERSLEMLRSADRCVAVSRATDWIPNGVPAEIVPYLRDHPTGKQLALIMSLPVERPALYIDSDVLFFSAAGEIQSLLEVDTAPAFYLADCQLSADDRLFRSAEEAEPPVNTGVLLLVRKLDWSLSIGRFQELDSAPNFFTNQTMTHLSMHANGAKLLDPQKFVLQLDDQFAYPDRYAGPALALRHYVNPVRHKFWTSLLR